MRLGLLFVSLMCFSCVEAPKVASEGKRVEKGASKMSQKADSLASD